MQLTSCSRADIPRSAEFSGDACGTHESGCEGRVSVSGKFFRLGKMGWTVKGVTYGPFEANHEGWSIPPVSQARRDLSQIAALGCTSLRLYHVPPIWFLDDALAAGLRVLIDVPWQKHRCFLEDWQSGQDARDAVRDCAARLGHHLAVLGISVANEIPKDVVRYYGPRRVERFLGELLEIVKHEAPQCLTTYTNYPSTEFLTPGPLDFVSFNVYLEDSKALGAYLDRLQHVAGPLPLVLGECGLDSYRHGEAGQAEGLRRALQEVYRRGLAGAYVFSFTDEWFTGGHLVEKWGFGITDRTRLPKPSAGVVREVWGAVPLIRPEALPAISVVVCSYNGAATLEECLRSLVGLNYPDYEVIVVDDGSTDATPQIAAKFPQVRTIRQENLGLSAARNTGARAARGQVVAFTDSDCVADANWLLYLAMAMRDQEADAIGGPNLPPADDNWVAKCVAASPGGPSHVMLGDRRAEHVPGCNMAFDRAKLLAIGGFDPQFRVAGDDVDMCWRFLDAGLTIGYAPAAFVWHHRRATVRAYLKQQQGYGKSEAMLQFKHPGRFNRAGAARWNGIIYGEGAVGLPLRRMQTYYGRFGTGLFQMVYRNNEYSPWAYFTLLEWHLTAMVLLACALAFRPLGLMPPAMWGLSLLAALRSSWNVQLPAGAPAKCRPLVFFLHLLQPVVRAARRYGYRLRRKKITPPQSCSTAPSSYVKRLSGFRLDLYWESGRGGYGREELLESLTRAARASQWPGIFDDEWSDCDVTLFGGWWHGVRLRTATEELGNRRFTRVRFAARRTCLANACASALLLWSCAAAAGGRPWAIILALVLWAAFVIVMARSAGRSLRRVADLVWTAGAAADLEPIPVRDDVMAKEVATERKGERQALDEAAAAGAFVG